MAKYKKYLYCVIHCDQGKVFDTPPLQGHRGPLHTIHYHDLAAVASDTLQDSYSFTQSAALAHEKIVEEVMKDFTPVPVPFGTVASTTSKVIQHLLQPRFQELHRLFERIEGKVEYLLKGSVDKRKPPKGRIGQRKGILVSGSPISQGNRSGGNREHMNLMSMAGADIERLRDRVRSEILAVLHPLVSEAQQNPLSTDEIINTTLLPEKDILPFFKARLRQLTSEYAGRLTFKLIGPTPAYRSVRISLDAGLQGLTTPKP